MLRASKLGVLVALCVVVSGASATPARATTIGIPSAAELELLLEENWTAVGNVVKGDLTSPAGLAAEDMLNPSGGWVGIGPTYPEPGWTAYNAHEGLEATRVSWLARMRTPALIAGRTLQVGGALIFGYQLGTILNEKFFDMHARIDAPIDGGAIASETFSWSASGGAYAANYPNGYYKLVFNYVDGPLSCDSFMSWAPCKYDGVNYPPAAEWAAVANAQWVKHPSYDQYSALLRPEGILQMPGVVPELEPGTITQPAPAWPAVETEAGTQIKNTILNYPQTAEWITNITDPTGQPHNPVAAPGVEPEPDPGQNPDPSNPPITEPTPAPSPTPGVGGCPSPLATDIDFAPLLSTGLADKFPFGVVAWLHTTLAGWAGSASAPAFTVSMAGHDVSIDLGLADGAMAIIRAALVALGAIGMVWWFSTALLGLRE